MWIPDIANCNPLKKLTFGSGFMCLSTKDPKTIRSCSLLAMLLTPLLFAYRWVNEKGYAQGVFWAVMVCLLSSLNDVFIRLAGSRLAFEQVAFCRFFFSTLTIVPFMLYFDRSAFLTKRPVFQVLRAILGYGAIACWVAGVSMTTLTIASIMAQTVGIFVLVMACLVLREKVGWQRSLATLAGMTGIVIILLAPKDQNSFTLQALASYDIPLALQGLKSQSNVGIFLLLAAAIMFAASDILNKIMVSQDSVLTMLFYFAVGTTFIGVVPALLVWQAPAVSEFIWLFCLGGGANLILYCLLKAFAATDISALQPYRYIEIFFATGFGFLLFGEIPTIMIVLGAAIIIPSTFTIAIYETRKNKRQVE